MYEAVHPEPEGDSTVAQLVRTAARQGYDGLVVRNHDDSGADFDAKPAAQGDSEVEGGGADALDVVEAIEIRTDDPSRASGLIANHRSKRTIVLVHGGELNRFAVEEPKVDVLAHPMDGGDVNHVLMRAAAENGVRVEFNFSRILRAEGPRRVRAVQGVRKLRELVEKYDVPAVVTADPFSHLHIRAPRELAAVGQVIGFDRESVMDGLREWGRLATRNRELRSETFVEPGVRRVDDDEST